MPSTSFHQRRLYLRPDGVQHSRRGFANFGALTATSVASMSIVPLLSSVEDWQPFGAACNEDVADGQQFGYDLAFVGSFFTGVGEEAEASQGLSRAERALQQVGEGCGLKCFTAATLLQMADGSTKRIVDVQVGDQVLSRNPATGKDEAKTVTATVERHAPVIVDVVLRDAKTGKTETLTCTPEHPLYVQSQGWVEAGSVGIGSSIVSRAGPALQVTGLTWEKNKAQELVAGSPNSSFGGYTVYNLTVEDDHTFFVGTSGGGTWVHNNCQLELPMDGVPSGASDPIRWHHPWPKYLGGDEMQPLVGLPKSYHDAIHNALDQIYNRRDGADAFRNVPHAEIEQVLRNLYNRFPLQGFPWRGTGGHFR